jgi:ATP-dependent DNA helicase DinG
MTIAEAAEGLRTFEEAQAVLAASLPGYTRRPHQIELGNLIEKAMADKATALTQAGCGTGKSLAGLIPAVIRAYLSGSRTVFATATKALQEQYRIKDLPFLLENLGIPFTYAILKGRSNYPCHAKIDSLASPTPAQSQVVQQVAAKGEDGVLDRDLLPVVTDREWAGLSMSSSECPGAKACPFAEQCHAERAKAEAAEADIVVTNVAYLLQDLALRLSSQGNVALLGEYDQLVIDEAHNLPDQATGALSDTFSYRAFTALGSALENFLAQYDGDIAVIDPILAAANALSVRVDAMYATWVERHKGKTDPMPLPLKTIIEQLGDEFAALYQAIMEARAEVKSIYIDEEDVRGRANKARVMRRVDNWTNRIMRFTTESQDLTVRWIEQEETEYRGRKDTRRNICSAPIEVGPFLRAAIWDVTPAVLMSATLATGQGDFSYIEHRLGLNKGEALTLDVGTPFDYAKQAVLFVPDRDQPAPNGATTQAWRTWSQTVTEYMVNEIGGGALLLFTSRSGMNDAYRRLADGFRRQGMTVLKQGDMMTGQLIAEFKQGGAVLFGLRTFFEGIDIPGDALRLVVLDKLPFAVPSDVLVAARAEKWDRHHPARGPVPASFGDLAVPAMTLVLQQAFGRLIRHADDKGVVAILDSRLGWDAAGRFSKSYGKRIVASLPPAGKTTDVRQAMAFLR